ncbi:MAG: hypothetical protein FJW36_19770 [Acidobacteria bacterium]|nr:hypothetical protein [Acidobacteriota bacterium]
MRIPLLSIATLLLTGCAYVGDPLPPALKVPKPVTDLAVRQVGGELLVSFTIPDKTLEDLALKSIGAVDLKIGVNPKAPFDAERWSDAAKPVATGAVEPGKVDTKVPVSEWANQEVVIGVRLGNAKGRMSPWSNFVTLNVMPALARPTQLRAVATATGVLIDWAAQAKLWKIYRFAEGDKEPVEMATVKEPKFIDIGAAFDAKYQYTVVSLAGDAVSETSEPVTITPVDTFAPTAPQGLSALAGPTAAQLSWERNQEPDLALYRVYRASGDGVFARIAESPSAASYRDAGVKAGQNYRYAVSAVDRKGNESPKSEPVEIQIP